MLEAVRERARRERRSAGEVLSELARASLNRSALAGSGAEPAFHGFQPLPHRGPLVTNSLVDRLREDEGG